MCLGCFVCIVFGLVDVMHMIGVVLYVVLACVSDCNAGC